MNFIELFEKGGVPLIIIVGFMIFLGKTFQYFVDTFKTMNSERLEIVNKFDAALQVHCNLVIAHLTQMEERFQALETEIERANRRSE